MATMAITTGAQFDALPFEEGRLWELLDGELIAVPSPTPRHQEIVFRVLLALRRCLDSGPTRGLAYPDIEFALSANDRLRPGVAVLLGEQAAGLDKDRIPVPGAPDVAVEVIPVSERAAESHDKVRTYLRNRTAEVWQIYPRSRTLQIHMPESGRAFEADSKVSSALMPGFALPIASLFE